MSVFNQLTEKSWETPGTDAYAEGGRGEDLNVTAPTALWLYFGVATVMFGLIFAGYLMIGNHAGMEHGMARDWRPLPATWLLGYNTGVLVLSSIAWEWARRAAPLGERLQLQSALTMGGVLAFIFLIGQLAVWQQLRDGGYFAVTNPAVAFFYVVIVLHGLHLLGGLAVWGRTMTRLLGRAPTADLLLSVNLCARYWHYLLLVWLVMFALLVAG